MLSGLTVVNNTPYTGQLTTNCYMPTSIIGAGNTGICRRAVVARGAITSIQFVLPGWYANVTSGFFCESSTGDYTASTWVEYPNGTYTQVDTNITVVGGTNTLGGILSIAIPNGTRFFVWTWASGTFPYLQDATVSNSIEFTDEFCNINTSGVATAPSGSPVENSVGRRGFGPVALIGPRIGTAVACVGDSRMAGTNDLADISTNRGNIARSVGKVFANINLGVGGDEPAMFLYGYPNRLALAKNYCTHIVDELGINCFNNKALLNVYAYPYKARMAAKFSTQKYVSTTLEPKASSTDTFKTAANQTALLPESANFNTNIRALSNYIELRTPVEDPLALGKWLSDGSTASLETSDGLHQVNKGYVDISATSDKIIAAVNAATAPGTSQPASDLTMTSPTYDTSTQKFGSACLNGGWGYIAGLSSSVYPFTMECWYKASAAGAGNSIYIIGQGSGVAAGVQGIANNSSGFAAFRDSSGSFTASTVSLTDGVWHHLALVITSTTYTLYVDGTSAATKSLASVIAQPNLFFVKNSGNISSPSIVTGSIDEVAIWNSQKYTGNFTPPVAPYVGNEAGLISLWHLDSSGAGVLGPVL